MAQNRDISTFLERLPSGRTLAWGLLRLTFVVVLTNTLWRETALAQTIHDAYATATDRIINASRSGGRLRILSGLQSEYLYNLFVPLMVFAFLPLRNLGARFSKLCLSTLFVALLDLIQAVVRNKWAYNITVKHGPEYYITQAKPYEQIVLMTFAYSLVPILSILLASLLIDKVALMRQPKITTGKKKSDKSQPKVGRNDPCPCGSGKKYKRCCGA